MISIRKKCVSSNYNNHNGMSLFDITGEAFPCKVLPCLQKFAVREYFSFHLDSVHNKLAFAKQHVAGDEPVLVRVPYVAHFWYNSY